MDNHILEQVTGDQASIPPDIFRIVRYKFLKTAMTDIVPDITPFHFLIINILMERRSINVVEIGQRLEITKALKALFIEKIVGLRIVERQLDAKNREIINFAPTEQRISILEEQRHTLIKAVREKVSFLSDKEFEDLSDSLRYLWSILRKLQ